MTIDVVNTIYQYRIWCNEDSKYVVVWGKTPPTECPENNVHSIDPDKTTIIDSVSDTFPTSDLDGKKVAVHPSYKPNVEGGTTYAIWTGSGDDLSKPSEESISNGDLLFFHMTPQTGSPLVKQVVTKDVRWDPAHGRVWLHEGYLKFANGGEGDYISADVVAQATPLQTAVNLELVIEDNWVKYAVGSPNPATHGWAGTPILVPRSYSKDGDWDYDGANLTPNFAGTGEYKISSVERVVHRFVNKVPCYKDCATYFSMTSDETTEVPTGYFLRIHAHNESNTEWTANVLMEIYRERTHVP